MGVKVWDGKSEEKPKEPTNDTDTTPGADKVKQKTVMKGNAVEKLSVNTNDAVVGEAVRDVASKGSNIPNIPIINNAEF